MTQVGEWMPGACCSSWQPWRPTWRRQPATRCLRPRLLSSFFSSSHCCLFVFVFYLQIYTNTKRNKREENLFVERRTTRGKLFLQRFQTPAQLGRSLCGHDFAADLRWSNLFKIYNQKTILNNRPFRNAIMRCIFQCARNEDIYVVGIYVILTEFQKCRNRAKQT